MWRVVKPSLVAATAHMCATHDQFCNIEKNLSLSVNLVARAARLGSRDGL